MSKEALCIGTGLISARTNQSNDFTVYTPRGGLHGLSVSVDGPSKAAITTNTDREGSVKCGWTPTVAGDYRIIVKYDGISVKGSPFAVHARGVDNVLSQSSPIGRVNTEPLNSFDKKFMEADADYDRKANNMANRCSRVRVSGRGLYSGIVNISNEVNVDVREAGQGRLHWTIEGPGHVESRNAGIIGNAYKLYYKTSQPGEYILKLKWDDAEVAGSPFHIRINLLSRNFNVVNTVSGENKINKVLIANRGEIAVRIIKTARRLGIKCVAVYSDVDKESMHVHLADEAYCIGAAQSSQSYLNQAKILDIAAKSKADAIHPGYGFLSENFEFSSLCKANNLIFIGPPENAIRDMGVKSTSKQIMIDAKVPVIPGYHGNNQDPNFLLSEAKKLGFPIMIKAVRGGGGKGMRICLSEDEFFDKLNSAKNEAMKSFSNDEMLIEKYIQRPRHIEVQVFGDQHGNYVYLFERDCSVQRRHQKIIEEAPAPGLDEKLRQKLGEAAVNAARAVQYVGAGTVEFVFDSETKEFYFMEMNTRLQVEHPITEMITKTDLVEMQFSVANGDHLSIRQDDLKIHGHSFEARIYAEDPSNEFLPVSGRINHLIEPEVSSDVRVETGVREGDEVSVYYDPMIAKLVVWSEDREKALNKLKNQLSNYKILGLKTNIPFLMKLSSHSEFVKGNVYTGFIPDYHQDLFPKTQLDKQRLVKLAIGLIYSEINLKQLKPSSDPFQHANSFRSLDLNEKTSSIELINPDTQETIEIKVQFKANQKFDVTIGDEKFENISAVPNLKNKEIQIDFDGYKSKFSFLKDQSTVSLFEEGKIPLNLELKHPSYLSGSSEDSSSENDVLSPMPGVVESILVAEGDQVKKGQPVAVIIAMKMEYMIKSNKDQVVDKIMHRAGDNVSKGAKLITFM